MKSLMTHADTPAVSVVISTCSRANDLRETLDSLFGQTAHGSAFEVLVVDNNSTDGTRQVVEEATKTGFQREHCHE